MHYAFSERGTKMFNFGLLFLHGFSSKNHEILHKAVLTAQECEDYFFWKKWKSWEKKTVWGVCSSQDWSQIKKTRQNKSFFRQKAHFEHTSKNSKKMG